MVLSRAVLTTENVREQRLRGIQLLHNGFRVFADSRCEHADFEVLCRLLEKFLKSLSHDDVLLVFLRFAVSVGGGVSVLDAEGALLQIGVLDVLFDRKRLDKCLIEIEEDGFPAGCG